MTCSYCLFGQGSLEGVGGVMWTYGVTIWATAPPEVWYHPADQPAGMDDDHNRGDDVDINTTPIEVRQARERAPCP